MAGKKGKTGRHTNRSNQWLAGTATRIRADEVFSFKPKIEVYDQVKKDIEAKGMTKSEWCDLVVERFFEDNQISHPLVQDAISDSIAQKQAALAKEKKSKRPDQELIDRWQGEIEELERLCSSVE